MIALLTCLRPLSVLSHLSCKSICSNMYLRVWCTSDRGRQFESNLWKKLVQLLGVKHTWTTSYHPISNGFVERFHRHLKSAIKSYPHPENWADILPLVLLGIRTSLKQDLGCTITAELVYGTTLSLHSKLFWQSDDSVGSSGYVHKLNETMKVLRCKPIRKIQSRAPMLMIPSIPLNMLLYGMTLSWCLCNPHATMSPLTIWNQLTLIYLFHVMIQHLRPTTAVFTFLHSGDTASNHLHYSLWPTCALAFAFWGFHSLVCHWRGG